MALLEALIALIGRSAKKAADWNPGGRADEFPTTPELDGGRDSIDDPAHG
jgi:hypothetical protein